MDDSYDETETHEGLFEEALGENDYGLIIDGETGDLKGMWIPKGSEEDLVPEVLVRLCVDFFGIDESAFYKDDLGTPPNGTYH